MTIAASSLLEGLSLETLASIIDSNSGLASPMFGYIAEHWLSQQLSSTPGVVTVKKIPDREKRKGDFAVRLEDREVTIELKCLSSCNIVTDPIHQEKRGRMKIAHSDPRVIDGQSTISTPRGEYDVLSICTFALTGSWDYWFIHNKHLPSSALLPGRVATTLIVTPGITPFLFKDLFQALA